MANKNCINLEDIANATCPLEAASRGGVKPSVIFGYHDDVETWPSYPKATTEAALGIEAAGKLVGDLVMKSGTRAFKLDFTEYTGAFTITDQGERGSESVLMQLTLTAGKIRAAILGFMNATRGRRMFFIVTDNNGNKYLMGDEIVAAYRTAAEAATTGQAATDANNVPLQFSFDALMGCTYEGDVETLLQSAV